jgi:hypothetical protein
MNFVNVPKQEIIIRNNTGSFFVESKMRHEYWLIYRVEVEKMIYHTQVLIGWVVADAIKTEEDLATWRLSLTVGQALSIATDFINNFLADLNS